MNVSSNAKTFTRGSGSLTKRPNRDVWMNPHSKIAMPDQVN